MKMKLPGTDLEAQMEILGECSVLITQEQIVAGGTPQWHMSISHPHRDPTYYEIKEARYKFVPDNVHMAMIFPPRAEFVNVDKHCFHLFEI